MNVQVLESLRNQKAKAAQENTGLNPTSGAKRTTANIYIMYTFGSTNYSKYLTQTILLISPQTLQRGVLAYLHFTDQTLDQSHSIKRQNQD